MFLYYMYYLYIICILYIYIFVFYIRLIVSVAYNLAISSYRMNKK